MYINEFQQEEIKKNIYHQMQTSKQVRLFSCVSKTY